MTKEEKEGMRMVWNGESVESVVRKTGLNSYWLKMVTGKQ